MSFTKSETVVWAIVGAVLIGVLALAFVAGRDAPKAPAKTPGPPPAAETESAGIAPVKKSELLPVPPGELGSHPVVERSGRAMNTSELRGKLVVADFIFTSCGGTCPSMAAEMVRLQKAIGAANDVRLVSFSVDPDRDSVAVLAEYAARYGADKDRWLFLRSEKPVIQEIAYDRLKLVKSREELIMHSSKFALLDREGFVRAYYSPLSDDKWLTKMLSDLDTLRAEPAR